MKKLVKITGGVFLLASGLIIANAMSPATAGVPLSDKEASSINGGCCGAQLDWWCVNICQQGKIIVPQFYDPDFTKKPSGNWVWCCDNPGKDDVATCEHP